MTKYIYQGIDIFNPIEGRLNYFVDAFAKVYGEQYRGMIEKKLYNAKYFFVGGSLNNIINNAAINTGKQIKKILPSKMYNSLKNLKVSELIKQNADLVADFKNCIEQQSKIINQFKKDTSLLLFNQISEIRRKNGCQQKVEYYKQYIDIYYDILTLGSIKLARNFNLLSENKKTNYKNFFEFLGYPKQISLYDYLNYPNLIEQVFDMKIVVMLDYVKENYKTQMDNANLIYTNFIKQFKQLGVKDEPYYVYEAKQYINNSPFFRAFVLSAFVQNNNYTSLCFCKNALELRLETLTHEMGHIIDNTLVAANENGYCFKTGFEFMQYGFATNKTNNNNQKYEVANTRDGEIFNEMVNEYFSEQVATEILKTGQIFTFEENDDDYSLYALSFEAFGDFFKKYREKLIEFKLSPDKNAAARYFGKKNLTSVMHLAKTYLADRIELDKLQYNKDPTADEKIKRLNTSTKLQLEKIAQQIEKNLKFKSIFSVFKQKTNKNQTALANF